MLLNFDRVTKFYGPVIGINEVSFSLQPGITGLLGANGAGKSTLIKLASGQLRPSLGAVQIAGRPAWSTAAKWQLGYSPDINSFYEEMTGEEFVQTLVLLNGYSRSEARQRTTDALREVGMLDRKDRRLAGCSHGMRQRIKLAQALVHDPPLLLLDEPLSGIDPGGRREINELLFRLAERGKTILVSSHILVEIEQLAHSILMLSRGRLVASGTLAEIQTLLARRRTAVEIVARPVRRLAGCLAQAAHVEGVEIHGDAVVVRTRDAAELFALVNRLALDDGIEILKMQPLDTGAEAVFTELEKGAS